jgi:hypothetical protein
LSPGTEQLIGAQQPIAARELDQCLDAGTGAIARQRRERRELSFGEGKAPLDRKPACPLGGGARIGLGLTVEQGETDRPGILETRRARRAVRAGRAG